MPTIAPTLSNTWTVFVPRLHPKIAKPSESTSVFLKLAFLDPNKRYRTVCCTKMPSWEPSPIKYVPVENPGNHLLPDNTNMFAGDTKNESSFQILKWPMWLFGPSLLLATGLIPTLWLPISSIYIGPNLSSLFSLIGLDCIFHFGATLFLLMADTCARPKYLPHSNNSKPPLFYRFWNTVSTLIGFIVPLAVLYGSEIGIFEPQLRYISFAVLLGPYFLLLSVQMLTEILTWHWESPVWLVTPVVYEAYRILQLMRGMKLGAELNAPTWMLDTIRGLVSWWALILGIQLMRVAWFAGCGARSGKKQSSPVADS
ncbi:hypothetical protein ACFE04_019093 [Oxalis oulophora]